MENQEGMNATISLISNNLPCLSDELRAYADGAGIKLYHHTSVGYVSLGLATLAADTPAL